jgi:hypothetical protein
MFRFSALARLCWLWLPLLLAFAVRGPVPPGWMVDRDSGGTLTVRICSDIANPAASVTIPFERQSGDDSEDMGSCPWGAVGGAGVLPPAPADLEARLFVAAPEPFGHPTGFAPGAASPLPPSTGPPSFA